MREALAHITEIRERLAYGQTCVGFRSLPVAASVRLISACQDNQVAMDGLTNGLFTGRLLEAWGEGAFQGDYRAFHRAILDRMPPDQTPNLYLAGLPSPAYDAQRPFDI